MFLKEFGVEPSKIFLHARCRFRSTICSGESLEGADFHPSGRRSPHGIEDAACLVVVLILKGWGRDISFTFWEMMVDPLKENEDFNLLESWMCRCGMSCYDLVPPSLRRS